MIVLKLLPAPLQIMRTLYSKAIAFCATFP